MEQRRHVNSEWDQAVRLCKMGERLRQPGTEGLKMVEDAKSDSHLYIHQLKNWYSCLGTFSLRAKKKGIQTMTTERKHMRKENTQKYPLGNKHFIYLFLKETTAISVITELQSTEKPKEWNGLDPSTKDITPCLSLSRHSEKSHYLERNFKNYSWGLFCPVASLYTLKTSYLC